MTRSSPPTAPPATLAGQLAAFARAITADDDAAASLFRLTPQGGAPRLAVYRRAYRARLADALRENYPVLHRLLGDDDFTALAHAFIAARPSRTPSIRWFGSELPDHLQALAGADALPHPALPDLARMEWALGTAFDAADAETLGVGHLLAVAPDDWPALRFTAHPSLRLITLDWAVEPLWRVLSENPEGETTPPEANRHHLLVWRDAGQTRWRSVEGPEAELLQAALDGEPFAALCELAAATAGDRAAETAAGLLRVWVEAGLFKA